MKKFLLSFLALAIAVSAVTPAYATDYTVEPNTAIKSNSIPIFRSSASMRGSITQQIYLPSEFSPSGASAGNITAVTFYYAAKDNNAVEEFSRSVEIWLSETDVNSYSLDKVSTTWNSKFLPKGTKVFDGTLATEGSITSSSGDKTLTLTFNTPFAWDGSSNIVLTLYDKSTTDVGSNAKEYLKFYITATDHARFVHQQWTSGYSFTDDRDAWMANLHEKYGYPFGSEVSDSIGYANKRNFVPKTTFSIDALSTPSVPTGLAASENTTSSITLSWNSASSATAYDLQQSADGENWSSLATGVSVTSYTWTGLAAGTSYFVRVRATNTVGNSDWSDAVPVATEAEFVYKEITFEKWNSTTSMPTSGNYYLANDVEISGYSNITLANDLNLCLNGHNILTSSNCIIVPAGVTFAIYDNEGSGVIRGACPGGWAESGLISIKDGGTLNISEGGVVNLANEANDYNLAIDNKGTLILSGAPTISGVKADIYLANSKVITINGALANTTPYKVNAVGQVITSGWSTHMSGEIPGNYFASAKSGYSGVVLSAGEAKLVQAVALSESDDSETFNSKISGKTGVETYISLTRSLTSAQYNTFCLPFALDDDQLQEFFGADYNLQELTGSSLTGETLNLEFTKRTALEAGKPYLLQPSVNVTNPVVFEGVTITATSPGTSSTTYVDYQAVYSPTSLAGGNRNLLFLGADNELFWPESTGNLNGFRAYFEIKGAAAQAAKRARISMGGKMATGNLSPALPQGEGVKILRDGKLYLMYKGQMYDVQGKRI